MSGDPETIVAEGEIVEVYPNGTHRIRMQNGFELTAFCGVKMREKRIQHLPREKVLLEISPYDLSRGRIVAKTGGDSLFGMATASSLRNPGVASGEVIPAGGFCVP